jgi:hypothetical protein
LRAALGKMEAAMADRKSSGKVSHPKPTPEPKAPPAAKVDKRARSAKATAPKISPGFKLGSCRRTADRRRRGSKIICPLWADAFWLWRFPAKADKQAIGARSGANAFD